VSAPLTIADVLEESGDPCPKKALKARLARFMDPQAFEPVPNRVKHTSRMVGKTTHDKRKVRREIALKRADAAIRFFLKPENAEALANRAALAREQGQ